MAYSDLPWLRGGDFLRAIIAGSDDAMQRERLRLASQRDRQPRFGGGGGGFLPRRVAAPEEAPEPTGPYLGGIPGSPVLIDKARTEQPEAPRLPFTVGGRQFITNDNGAVVDYVAPPNLSTPFGGQQAGYFQLDPKTGRPTQIIPPTPKTADEARLSTVDTANMTDTEKQMAAMFNPSRVSGPASVVQRYLQGGSSQPQAYQSEAEARASGARAGDTIRIAGVGLVKLK